jgi:hypothetical protein
MPILRRTLALAVAGALAATPALAQSPFWTEQCPLPAGFLGYPVSVRAADGAPLAAEYAASVADAVARRWEPPSAARRHYGGLARLRERARTPEPRWPQDGLPSAGDTARVTVTLHRAAAPGEARLLAGSGDRAFDRLVLEHFRSPAPATPPLPALPAGTDSVRVEVGFGVQPAADAAVVRFAAQQTAARLVPGSMLVSAMSRPRTGRAQTVVTVKYDIDAGGRINRGSIEMLSGGGTTFANSLLDALPSTQGVAAVSNCRPVASSVVQIFRLR